MADNDYATGLLIEKVAKSPYANNTLIFVIEDDVQNGLDHVDAHRSIAFVVGPYVKQGAVISTKYTTVNMVRTIEEVLAGHQAHGHHRWFGCAHDRGVYPHIQALGLHRYRAGSAAHHRAALARVDCGQQFAAYRAGAGLRQA
jgi:hypothetical protein